jgi:hypothetical protein
MMAAKHTHTHTHIHTHTHTHTHTHIPIQAYTLEALTSELEAILDPPSGTWDEDDEVHRILLSQFAFATTKNLISL